MEERKESFTRTARGRSAAEIRRVSLARRFSSGAQGGGEMTLDRAITQAMERQSANRHGLTALRAALLLPGLGLLGRPEQLAVIAAIDGPTLGPEVEPRRAWMVSDVWRAVQERIEHVLTPGGLLRGEEQAALFLSMLHEPTESATLLTCSEGHTVLAIGWRPGETDALLTYGRRSHSASKGGGTWGSVNSPDGVMYRRFRSVAGAIYDYTVYAISLDDQRQLIEWMEPSLAANALTLERSFVRHVQSYLTVLGRGRSSGGVVEQGAMRASSLVPVAP